MGSMLIYPAGTTAACGYAAEALEAAGYPVTDHIQPEITHLLLDVPSFSGGQLRGGGSLDALLARLPPNLVIIGGMFQNRLPEGCKAIDLLEDASYLAENAAITADCALRVAGKALPGAFQDSPALVIGWGRIGKCLAKKLQALGCPVTVAARRETDRAMLRALGYQSADTASMDVILPEIRMVFNTAPEPVLGKEQTALCRKGLFIDLASKPGIAAEHVIWARGLPGVYAPEAAGKLIANRFLALWEEETA